ncbi:MAG: hypothetical protein ABIT16_09055 [Croceibacterium sp.]
MTTHTRRMSSRKLASLMALAIAVPGVAAFAVPAAAQPQSAAPAGPAAPAQPQLKPSRNFAKVYQPVAEVANAAAGDYASAKAQLPGVIAAVESPDDRYLAGTLSYVLGLKLQERPLQQQGMELMLQSGKAAPDAAGEMNYFLGEWAYDAANYAQSRTYLKAARDAGYTQGNAEGLTAESYFKENQSAQGLAYLEGLIAQMRAAGQAVPDVWIRRGLKVGYDAQDATLSSKWASMLVSNNPIPENWLTAVQVVEALSASDQAVRLDLLRLASLTNSLTDRRSYENYVQAADPRIMANEVSRVLAAGKTAGIFTDGDAFYTENKVIADQRSGAEASDAADYARTAASAATGRPAQNAGEIYLALQNYPKAEEMLQLALTKGGIDRDTVLTRLGIAQIQQGKSAAAKATFGQVTGARAPVAQLWAAYAGTRT